MVTSSESWSFPHCPQSNDWSINWSALENEFYWLKPLAECQQDPRYHAEGDVLTHTKLVCEALVALPEWRGLAATERSVLFAAALLHDVAKPNATQVEEDGAITSKGHVLQGAKMAQQILWDMDVPLREREGVVALVKYGSLPLWFWDKPNPEWSVIKTSQIIRCDMLAMLAEADVKGRYCDDRELLLERIDFWREFCQENNCFDKPRVFPSPHGRFVYFQKEDGYPDYEAYDDTRFQVVLMSGLPGSGKDTWIQRNLPDCQVISLDELRQKMGVSPTDDQAPIVNQAKAIAKSYMREGESFVWNATNISRQLRGSLVRLFSGYNARVRIVYLEPSYSEILRRNNNRAARVPEGVIFRMRNKLEVPTIIEAHEVDWIVS